jgi:signal transduction histidine kinase/ligand-binding sensor domain-containing protein
MRIPPPLFLLLLTLGVARAQVLPVRTYAAREGLNASSISAVMRDSRGLLWVGTYNGVNLYDGNRFQQPAMVTRGGQIYVNEFAEDSLHQIWVASWYSGLYRYANGVFTNYLIDTVNIGSQANSILNITALQEGRLLCGTDHNVYVFAGGQFRLLDPRNRDLDRQITGTACNARDDVFVGHSNGVEFYMGGGGRWGHAISFLQGFDVHKLVVCADTLWIATNKGLYFQSRINDFLRRDYFPGDVPKLGKVAEGDITNVFPDASHNLWYTRGGDGIWRQGAGGAPEHFTRANGLPSAVITSGCSDAEGIVWLGTESGLAKLTPAGYRFFPVAEGEEGATIIALAKDAQQRLWAGSYNNVFRFDGATARDQPGPSGRSFGFVYAMLRDRRNQLWVCASSGVYRIGKGAPKLMYPDVYTSISEDDAGVIWLGGQQGQVLTFEKEKFAGPDQDRLDQRITGIWHDKEGAIWVGYAQDGLRKFQLFGDSLRLVHSWSAGNGYAAMHVRSLRDDHHGHLLAGTRTGGLFIIDKNSNDAKNITREQGLSGNWIKDIVTREKQIYLATNNGLDVLEAGRYDQAPGHIAFNDDRIPVEFNSALLQSDTLWLGTSRGILEYSLHSEQPDSLAPAVRLLKVAVNGQADSGFRLFTSDTQLRRLSYTQNNVSVDFAALSFRDEDRVRYRYRLEGLDTGFNAFTDRRYVNYMNLAPGNYRFLVEARNADGLTSRQPAAIRFTIAAPFWRTGWFIALCILVFLLLAYGFYRYRLHQALAIERLRARISTDLHDDTGSTLSGISILSDMALQEEEARAQRLGGGGGVAGGDGDESGVGVAGGGGAAGGARDEIGTLTPMLREIRDNSLSLLEKMDDIVWSINPRNDTLESLMLRVKRFAAQLFEARGIEYEIDIEPEIRHLRLLMDDRQNLYLIMKEAINNLVKYANAQKAQIRARYLRHHLVVEISDNGSGFLPEAMATGNGIINMRNRAEGMNAELRIQSKPGEGTTVVLSLKSSRP